MSASSLDVIDFHSHHVPSNWETWLSPDLSASQRERWTQINRRLADRHALVEHIESGDLAGRVVNIPTALFTPHGQSQPPEVFERANDLLAEIVAAQPGRLHGLASVDAFGGEAAARELTRAVRTLGLSGVFLESAKGDLLLDAPEALPTLSAAAALGVPVFMHPVNPQPLTRQMAKYPTGTLWARGTINAASLVALIGSGRLRELPDLKIVVTTLAIGAVLLEAAFGQDSEGILKRQIYIDTMGFHPSLIRSMVDVLGVDHVIAGSDWPIVSDAPIKPALETALRQAGIDEAGQKLIAAGNARRLLRITETARLEEAIVGR